MIFKDFAAASALMYVKKRSLFDVFPDGVKKMWNEWELRVLILLSLTLQIVLILLGKRRKYIARTWIRFTLWSAYLMADWVATVALGVISNSTTRQDCTPPNIMSKEMMSFWAPFLLLHLGGPDTITAYSLEDNELWLRHLLGLVVQTGVAVYIFLMAWPGKTWLPILSIPVFVAGLIKYGERTWALMSANTEQLRQSMLTSPDPGPNYAKFMEEFTLKAAEGFYVEADEVKEAPVPRLPTDLPSASSRRDEDLVPKAYELFQTFKRLFVDLILSFQDRDTSQSLFQKLEPEIAFRVIEVELGFAFDILYTKAPVVYTLAGCVLRFASFSSTFLVLVGLVFLCETHGYHKIDLIITYLLLVVAILLEIYAVILMLRSDWTDHWLSKRETTRGILVVPCLQKPDKLWWSNSMAQYNLLSFCFRDEPGKCLGIRSLLQIDDLREKHLYKTYTNVSPNLKEYIFNHFLEFTGINREDSTVLCTHRGSFDLKKNKRDLIFKWSNEVEFDQRILILHIATDLCYYKDCVNTQAVSPSCQESKHISDYMLYLLVMYPSLLPIGIGMIRFRDTCAEAREFFKERSQITCEAEACKTLLQVNTQVPPSKVKGDRSKSVLFDACILAKSLLAMEREEKWEIVCRVWVEMLAYAATHCRGNHHAQQLRKGGELLTHVWLLMAHLGITEQFQIDQGHARAKLIVK